MGHPGEFPGPLKYLYTRDPAGFPILDAACRGGWLAVRCFSVPFGNLSKRGCSKTRLELAAMKTIGLAALLLAAVLLLGLWPRDYVACPDWDIYVVDQDGRAMPGVAMHVAAMDPTVEDQYATVEGTTDAQGHVFVPRRVV